MSSQHYNMSLKNGQVMIDGELVTTNIYVRDGLIDLISDKNFVSDENIDCNNLIILPGVIDSQVHFREPGLEGKENLESGMLAAVSGGVTAIFEMPNTNPLTITPETISDKLKRASKGAWSDYAFYLGGTMRTSSNLSEWENLKGVCGIKIFMGASTGDLMTASDEEVESVVANGQRVIAVHAEDQMIMMENQKNILGDSEDVAMHCKWRSPESCLSATQRVVNLAKKHNRRVHILHITTEQEMDFEKNRFLRASTVIAVLFKPVSHPKIPSWEMELSTGAVCSNILVAAQSLGYAAQWLTEWYSYNDRMIKEVGGKPETDKLAGFIYIGDKEKEPVERRRPKIENVINYLKE